MVVIDSSAIVAALREEPDGEQLTRAAAAADDVLIGAPTLLECSIVLGPSRRGDLEEWLAALGAQVVPFTAEHARIARDAYGRYGRGSGHPARLNLGDVMTYAVAAVAGAPLLYKGNDFGHTDLEPALRDD
ncbi:type II toxin-antitoxin system VapC family toxin [Salana multivorans]